MATLTLTSTLTSINPIAGVNANLIVSTDVPFSSPPATVDLEIRVEGLVPDKDFVIADFVWTKISDLVYDGVFTFDYTDLTALNPLTFTVQGLAPSLIGNVSGVFTIQASGDYSVGSPDDTTLTLVGNSNDLVAVPPFITFDNGVVVGVKTNALVTLANNSGSTEVINSLYCNTGDATIFYENAGVWSAWVEGVTTLSMTTGTTKKILVQLLSTAAQDYSLNYLYAGYSIGAVAYVNLFPFEPATASTVIVTATRDIATNFGSVVWFDGSTQVIGNNPDDTVLPVVDACNAASLVIDVVLTSEADQVCVEDGNSDIRLGDIVHGWYPNLEQNIEDSVITFPTATDDSDYVLSPAQQLPATITVDCPTEDGEHTVMLNIIRRTCLFDTDNTVADYANGVNIAVLADIVPVTSTNDFLPIGLANTLQATNASAIENGSVTYVWAAHAINEPHTVNSFKAPDTGNYVFLIQYVLGLEAGATARDYALFLNGAYNQTLFSGVDPQSGELEITLAMSKDDTVQFGVFYNDSQPHTITESFCVGMRLYEKANIPLPENVYNMELSYTKVNCDALFSPSTIEVTKQLTKVAQASNIPLTITNTGDYEMVISAITIDNTLTGFTTWFPAPVTIPVGLSHTFYFAFNPLAVGTYTGNVSFTSSCGSDIVVPAILTVTELASLCTIEPTSEQYNVDVVLNIVSAFDDTVLINTNNNVGTLEVSKGGSYPFLTFGASPLGDTTIYRSFVVEDQTIPIPLVVNVTGDCPGGLTTVCALNWVLRDNTGGTDQVLCSGTVDFIYTVECPVETVCPLSFQDSLLDLYNLYPLNTGILNAVVLLDRDVSEIGGFTVELTLPLSESVLSFGTQAVITGVTWDETGLLNNPSVLSFTVDPDTFVLDRISIAIDYAIPASPTQPILYSTLSADTTFDNGLFECEQNLLYVGLSVILSSTSGGYETKVNTQLAVECETLNILDESVYGADSNHDAADFSLYRKIIITQPGGTDYVMATHGDYDLLITPASSGILSFAVSITDGGIYTVKLTSVPTFNVAGEYSQDDNVVVLSDGDVVFYQSLENNNIGYIPGSTPGWEDYWELITEPSSSYSDTKYYVQKCDIDACKKSLQRKVWCEVRAVCQTDICKSKCFKNLLKYELLEDLLLNAEALQDYNRLVVFYDDMKLLCDCTNDCQ